MPPPKHQTDILTKVKLKNAIKDCYREECESIYAVILRSSSVSRRYQQNAVTVVDVLGVSSSGETSLEHLLTLCLARAHAHEVGWTVFDCL